MAGLCVMLGPGKAQSLGTVLALCLLGAALLAITLRRPAVKSLDPSYQPRFVRLTSGWLYLETSDAKYYDHRFYVKSRSLSPMRLELFEQLEEWGVYRGALQRGEFTACERTVSGSNAVLWVGYEAKTPFDCSVAACLSSASGQTIGLTEMTNRRIAKTDRYVWSAVCSATPKPGEDYTLQSGCQRTLLFRAP